jgi:hypothetical protein
MKAFKETRAALEMLPGIREARDHGDKYARFLNVTCKAKEAISKAVAALPLVEKVAPSSEYVQARSRIASTARNARRLAATLDSRPQDISATGTDNDFTGLKEGAEASLRGCEKGWGNHLGGSVKQWKEISKVLSTLAAESGAGNINTQASKLSSAIRSLESAATVLPVDEAKATAVSNDLKAVMDAVAELDLETPFGKFLSAAASDKGADLTLLLDPDVQEALTKNRLQKSFKVRLA